MKNSKGLLQVYLLILQCKHRSNRINFSFELLVGRYRSFLVHVVSCFWFSWHASLLSFFKWRVWLVVCTRACLSTVSVVPTHILAFGVCGCLVRDFFCITHVWLNLQLFEVVSTPPPSVYGDSWCFKLWSPLQSSFGSARFSWDTESYPLVFVDSPLKTLQVSLIHQIHWPFRDRIFQGWLIFKNGEGKILAIFVNLRWTWSCYF